MEFTSQNYPLAHMIQVWLHLDIHRTLMSLNCTLGPYSDYLYLQYIKNIPEQVPLFLQKKKVTTHPNIQVWKKFLKKTSRDYVFLVNLVQESTAVLVSFYATETSVPTSLRYVTKPKN